MEISWHRRWNFVHFIIFVGKDEKVMENQSKWFLENVLFVSNVSCYVQTNTLFEYAHTINITLNIIRAFSYDI